MRLHKSDKDRILFGVCGGLAAYLDVDPVLVRLAFVLLIFAGGAGAIAYVVLALIMPAEKASSAEPAAVVRENLQSIPEEAAATGRRLADTLRGVPPEQARQRWRNALALILMVVGVFLLLANFGAFWWGWGKLWPLLLIALGALIILGRSRRAR